MAGTHETPGDASGSYTTAAEDELRRQWSVPAAAFFAPWPCGAARGDRSPGNRRNSSGYHGEVRGQLATTGRSAGGVSAVARALWAWVAKGRRTVLARSGSSSVTEQYGYEEYEQNFDEGAAAAEPENLSRSFSARYAVRRFAGAR